MRVMLLGFVYAACHVQCIDLAKSNGIRAIPIPIHLYEKASPSELKVLTLV